MKFLFNCPLKQAFIKCPSVLYQNYLREFWSTAVAYDPSPPIDETEQRPLRVYLIKFSVLNGQRHLTLDFNTFCSSTGLDYKNGKCVGHPESDVVKKESRKIDINPTYLDKTPVQNNSFPVATEVDIRKIIYSDLVTMLLNKSKLKYVAYPRFISCALQVLLGCDYTQDPNFGYLPGILSNCNFTKDPSKVTNIELTAHMIAVNNQKESVSPLPFSAKKKKVKSQTMTHTLPKSQGPKASESLPQTRKKSKSKKAPKETKETPPPEPTKEFEQSHSVSWGKTLDPKDPERNKQLAGMGLPSTHLDEGTRKSKLLTKGTKSDPKDLVRNIQPIDMGLPSMVPKGNKPPADIEPIHPSVADLSSSGAEYQVDETQSTTLRYQTLTDNEGKTSSKMEPGTQPLKFTAYVDVQAFLLSDDEMLQESDDDEVFGAGEDMDEDPQEPLNKTTPPQSTKEEHHSPPKDKPESSNAPDTESDSESSNLDVLKKYDNIRTLTKRQLVKYLRKYPKSSSINLLRTLGTSMLRLPHLINFQTLLSNFKVDHNTSMRRIMKLLNAIHNFVKDNPALNKIILKASKAYTQHSSNLTELLSLFKTSDFASLKIIMESLHDISNKKDAKFAN
ncbi:hypothetical protein Tco_0893311 [Tanacetum coccineum]|uniref:Uncharacterized protein n=1 Tax=Tanacetum coccineum TaxID=301880 RepID=A0ABQ5C9Z4_9ASTR